jgi:pantothenate kinase
MPPSLTPTQWLTHLRQRLFEPRERPYIVGLIGTPGSGKSTLAAQVVQALGLPAIALGMDGFHLTRAQLAAMPNPEAAFARRGAPWTFDPQALAQALHAVRNAQTPVAWPGFAHEVGDPVPAQFQVTAQHKVVLVEGLYLLHREHGWDVHALLDECAYLDTPPKLALQRLCRRHQSAWGISEQQALARIASNDQLNAAFVQASRERASCMVLPDF